MLELLVLELLLIQILLVIKLSIQYSKNTPDRLYYGLSKGGYISTSDTEVENYAEIRFVDSVYNGEYEIFDVTNDTFKISPLVPELTTYLDTDCEKLEYSTRSSNVHGAIKDFKIISLDLIIKNFLNLNQLQVPMERMQT